MDLLDEDEADLPAFVEGASPVTVALLMESAQRRRSRTVEQVAQLFSCSVTKVQQHLTLLTLTLELQAAVVDHTLPLRQAVRLASRSPEEQRAIVDKLREADAGRGARGQNSIDAALAGDLGRIGKDTRRMRPVALLKKLRAELDRAVKRGEGRSKVDALELLDFVLGGPVPAGDQAFAEALECAGFKR